MTNLEQAARMALEALEVRCGTHAEERSPNGAIEALRQALEQPKQEQKPVAWIYYDAKGRPTLVRSNEAPYEDAVPLFKYPPRRNPLTRDQDLKIVAANPDAMTAIRMTEADKGIGEQ